MPGILPWSRSGTERKMMEGEERQEGEERWEAGLVEVNGWDAKVICVGEELLNVVFWSFKQNRQSSAGRVAWLYPNRDRDKRRWMSLYRLSAALWHSCLCLCCLIYTRASAGTALPSSSQRMKAKWRKSLVTIRAFYGWHENLGRKQSVQIMEELNLFSVTESECERKKNHRLALNWGKYSVYWNRWWVISLIMV